MAETHRCADCGFLALWQQEDRQVDWRERRSGVPREIIIAAESNDPTNYRYFADIYREGVSDHLFRYWPTCFVNAQPVRAEAERTVLQEYPPAPDCVEIYGQVAAVNSHHAEFVDSRRAYQFRDAINKPRKCDDFFPWSPGSSPKEHLEMLDRAEEHRQIRNNNWRSLLIAFMSVVVSVFGIWIGAQINRETAKGHDIAQLEATRMQIDFQKTLIIPSSASSTATPESSP